jgi:hypothetical protein
MLMRAGLDNRDDHRSVLVHGLAQIADARGDVVGFIATQELAGDGSAAHAAREIADRFVGVGRLTEALQWLAKADRDVCLLTSLTKCE